MLTLDEDQLRYMSISQSKLIRMTDLEKGAYFQTLNESQAAWKIGERKAGGFINIDLLSDMANSHGRGEFTTFFHEYGHLVDRYAKSEGKAVFTDNGTFKKNLYNSLKKEYDKLCTKGVLNASVKKDLMASHSSNGVQDIISGLSLNKNRVYWGHPTKYWRQKGQANGVVVEAMAHFNAAWANPQSRAYMEKYFPESYNYFKTEAIKYVRGAIK